MATQERNGSRPAPSDEHAEAALLGAALKIPEVAGIVASLQPEDFFAPSHRLIAAAVGDLYRTGTTIDPVTVHSRLTAKQADRVGGPSAIVSLLASTPSLNPKNAEAWAARILEAKRRRQIIGIAGELIDSALDGDPASKLAELEAVALTHPTGDLERSLLGNMIREGVPEPTMVHSWLYAGGLHAVQSEPGVGKTMFVLWLAVQLMRAGWSVIYIDEEGGDELVAERLAALGADPEMVDRLFWYFPFPERRWTPADLDALRNMITKAAAVAPVAMGVLDSLPDFLAAATMDEDKSMDVTSFVRRLLTPFREVGAALVVLDHVKKADDEGGSSKKKKRSRYGRGSGAKLAKTHATLLLETAEPFDRQHSGKLNLWATKDRRGFTGLPREKDPPLPLDIHVADGSLRIEVGAGKDDTSDLEPWSGPTHCMESILTTLTPGEWLTGHQIETIMNYKSTTVRGALRELVDRKQLLRRPGPRNAIHYCLPDESTPVQEQL